jgi:hypothetical protein
MSHTRPISASPSMSAGMENEGGNHLDHDRVFGFVVSADCRPAPMSISSR